MSGSEAEGGEGILSSTVTQPTPTRAPFGTGTWRGRRLGRLTFLERG
jgi:hypothetical protein